MPKLRLAKLIYSKERSVFGSLDSIRSIIRHRTGANGKEKLSQIKERDLLREHGKQSDFMKLPESYAEKREPYIFPAADNNILVISDLHIPYHEPRAVLLALKYGKEQKINTILINGDLLDFHGLSKFEHDPRKRLAKDEIVAGQEFLYELRKKFPNVSIYYKKGNHDFRYEMWLMRNPQIFGMPEFELETLLRCVELRIKVIGDKQMIKAGMLNIFHGHEILRSATTSVNPARTLFLKAKESSLAGHTHKVSEHTETKANGDLITCWSTGSLCELSPDYIPYGSNYAHGFSHVKVNKDKSFEVRNFRIFNNKIL